MTVNFDQLSLEETWTVIEKTMNESPKHLAEMATTYAFNLSGDDGGQYGLRIDQETAKVLTGAVEDADCALSLSVKDFKKMLAGNLNSTASYMMGKLKVKGSLGLALKLESLLKKYSFE